MSGARDPTQGAAMTALRHAATLFAAWLAADVLLGALWALACRRRPRLPVDYGPLPVPLVPYVPARSQPLLAVDAVLWSYADAVGESPWPAS